MQVTTTITDFGRLFFLVSSAKPTLSNLTIKSHETKTASCHADLLKRILFSSGILIRFLHLTSIP